MKAKLVSFIAGMLFMITFGVVDNGLLFVSMDINPFIDPYTQPILSALWGNLISDGLGAVAGAAVSFIFLKVFKVKPSEHILIEIIGVVIGCLIPIGIFLLF